MEYLINILYLSFRDIVLDMDYTNTGILVSALNEGNILAFEYIYKTYYKSLLNYASRILKDVEASGVLSTLGKSFDVNDYNFSTSILVSGRV